MLKIKGQRYYNCPQNDLFHDARDIIITSRTNVREMNNDDDVETLVNVLNRH